MCLVQLRRGWSESDGVSVTFPTSLLQLTDEEQSQLVNVAVRRLRSLDLPCPVILTPRRQCHLAGSLTHCRLCLLNDCKYRMWANTQRDGRPAEYRWHPLFNAAKFGWRPLLECRAVTLPKRETR